MHRPALLLLASLAAAGPACGQARAPLSDDDTEVLLSNLAQHILNGDADEVDAIAATGVNLNAKTDMPQPPLELAAMSCSGGRVEAAVTVHMVETLLEAGADPNPPSIGGLTPLMTAAQQCDGAVIRRLVRAGARRDSRTPQGFTPLSMALTVKNYSAAEALLDAGARLDPASGRKLTEGSDDARLKALVDRATGV